MSITAHARRIALASLVVFSAACAGDAEDDTGAEGTGDNTILPADNAPATNPPGDVGDMGTGTGDAQSGGELTGEVPDSTHPAP